MDKPIDWILLIWGLIVAATSMCTVFNLDQIDCFVSTPKDLYESTTFNWVGVILLYILYLLMFPLVFILKFIYWIFHAGRRDS